MKDCERFKKLYAYYNKITELMANLKCQMFLWVEDGAGDKGLVWGNSLRGNSINKIPAFRIDFRAHHRDKCDIAKRVADPNSWIYRNGFFNLNLNGCGCS